MIREFEGVRPKIHPTAYIHDTAEIIGRVIIEEGASIWPGCVLRGDIREIRIGAGANIQDLTVIHTRAAHPTIVGKGVTVGHRVVLHGCRIGDRALIGMGAVVMEASIGREVLLGAGAVVAPGAKIPPRTLALGFPARVKRPLTRKEIAMLAKSERTYRVLARRHARAERPIFGRS